MRLSRARLCRDRSSAGDGSDEDAGNDRGYRDMHRGSVEAVQWMITRHIGSGNGEISLLRAGEDALLRTTGYPMPVDRVS